MNEVKCRQCGSSTIKNLGSIIEAKLFCGVELREPWPGGILYECNVCNLVFRHPLRDSETYRNLYESASENTYHNDSLRCDQILVRDAILGRTFGGSILDIGCFNGALLNSLGTRYQKFGIETSTAARKVCASAGIEVVADSAEQLVDIDRKFDVICLVDVVEHLFDPLGLIAVAARKLEIGGLLVISTGNSSNWMWRIFGGRYWYCAFPEHISFISPKWVSNVADGLSLGIVGTEFFAHQNVHISRSEAYIRFIGRLFKGGAEIFKAYISGKKDCTPVCKFGFPGVVKDHVLIILQRDK